MKVTIKLGNRRYFFDDDCGSDTPIDAAVEYIGDLLKSIYPEMDGMRLIVVTQQLADEMFDESLGSDVEHDESCPHHPNNEQNDEDKPGNRPLNN